MVLRTTTAPYPPANVFPAVAAVTEGDTALLLTVICALSGGLSGSIRRRIGPEVAQTAAS